MADLVLAGGERIRSFTIVTTTPIELCAELYHCMPVVLKPASLADLARLPRLKALFVPYPSDDMTRCPVSGRVSDVRKQ